MTELVRKLRATGGKGQGGRLKWQAADEIERLQKYAARLIERLERAPDETRAIDADLAARRKAQ